MAKVSQPDPGRAALADASREIGYARELIESLGFDRVETPPVEVSVIFFALGEVERQRALSIGFDPDAPDFSARLEERCRHVLDGQAAYSQVMRSRNAHWSAMAGVRVGELYFELHRELLDMGPPRTAARQEQQLLYWGAMRLRYGILLDKAVKMMERTLEMLDRTGEPTPFRDRAEGYLLQLREAERAEDDAISALPYSRAQLRAVLQDLSLKNGGSGEI
jgi:hypothetical protein